MENDIREQLRLLVKKKDEIEKEISHHRDILQSVSTGVLILVNVWGC